MSGTVGDNLFRASGVVASSSSEYDDDKIQSNIAMLGFKIAVNGSLARYNLVDQAVDAYEDTSGVDASASVNETRVASGDLFYYWGTSSAEPSGGNSTDTSVSGFTTRVFTSDGSLTVGGSGDVDILVIGGGGGGAGYYGGGGGSGGLIYKAEHGLTANTYDIVIGAGGISKTNTAPGGVGGDTTFTINGGAQEFIAKGGGGGGGPNATDGGSGGASGYNTGGAGDEIQTAQSGDSGTYGFGNDGGLGVGSPGYNPGGGGASGSTPPAATQSTAGAGGAGKDYSSIYGTALGVSGVFAGGGGGAFTSDGSGAAGAGGSGGGGAGATTDTGTGVTGTNGTGSGGGGSKWGASGAGGTGIVLVRYADDEFVAAGDLTLQSTDVTASTANPDYADMVVLMENAAGTATLNTDIKGYVSEDSGVTFTQGTFVDEGTWGTNKKIIAFHDLDISAQTGSAMCYKITTHNQSAGSKETRIYAASIGWR